MQLADYEIEVEKIVHPFSDNRLTACGLTHGVTSYGYDARVGRDYKVFTDVHGTLVDPKNFNPKCFVDFKDVDYCIIPPNSFALAATMERFVMPKDVLGLCIGKSTYARCGIILNITPLEPAWEGHVTVEISNSTPLPCKIYSGEGIMQVVFFRGKKCKLTYADKKGRYQNQVGITLPFTQG